MQHFPSAAYPTIKSPVTIAAIATHCLNVYFLLNRILARHATITTTMPLIIWKTEAATLFRAKSIKIELKMSKIAGTAIIGFSFFDGLKKRQLSCPINIKRH